MVISSSLILYIRQVHPDHMRDVKDDNLLKLHILVLITCFMLKNLNLRWTGGWHQCRFNPRAFHILTFDAVRTMHMWGICSLKHGSNPIPSWIL
jgi:hypothetical protein